MNKMNSGEEHCLSRREFLSLLGLAVGGAAETVIKLNQVFNWASAIEVWLNADSNISQKIRKQKLEAAALKSVGQPEVLTSWLKFCALEVYARTKGLVLAETVIRQFMYGKGEAVDITGRIPQSLRNYPDSLTMPWLSETEVRGFSDERLRYEWAFYGLTSALKLRDDLTTDPDKNKLRQKLEKGEPFLLQVSGAGDGPNRDCLYSLHGFSQFLIARVKRVQRSGEDWVLDLVKGKYRLTDRYKFDEGRNVNGLELNQFHLVDFTVRWLRRLGITDDPDKWLTEHLSREKLIALQNKRIIGVDDRDGLRLQEAGLACPVPITANWELPKFSLSIAKTYF